MPTASPIDLAVVVVYLLIVTIVGCLMSRKTHSASEFISAGGSLPGWVVGLSIVGTFVSSISFIANPGKTFSGNWNPFVFSLSLPYAAWVATRYFVPFFRNETSFSAYEHLEQRFGVWARVYAAIFNVLYHVFRIATILFGVSLAVSALIDVPIETIIIGLGTLVIAYTLMGGIEAVIWTDVVQSVILIGGMLACMMLLLWKVPGGLMGILEGAYSVTDNKLSLGTISFDLSGRSFWTVLLFGFFINLQNFTADQTFVQRYFTAKTEQAAKQSVWMGAIAYLPISAILFFIGTGLFVFYRTVASLPDGTLPDAVLPNFIMTELPIGISGLMIAAILAAAMSTVDSSLNSSATLLLCDVKNRFFAPKRKDAVGKLIIDDGISLRFLRTTTVVLGIAGIFLALQMIQIKSLLDVWWKVSAILSGGTLGLILLARFTNAKGALGSGLGVIMAVVCISAMALSDMPDVPNWLQPVYVVVAPLRAIVDPMMSIVVGTLVVVSCGVLFSLKSEQQRN